MPRSILGTDWIDLSHEGIFVQLWLLVASRPKHKPDCTLQQAKKWCPTTADSKIIMSMVLFLIVCLYPKDCQLVQLAVVRLLLWGHDPAGDTSLCFTTITWNINMQFDVEEVAVQQGCNVTGPTNPSQIKLVGIYNIKWISILNGMRKSWMSGMFWYGTSSRCGIVHQEQPS